MKFKKNLIAILVASIFLLLPLILFAQVENKAEGVTISPPLFEIEFKPGETLTQKIKVTNPVGKQIKVFPSAFDFKAKGETGEPLFLAPSLERRSYSLASWISFSKSFLILEPEEVEDFEYTIKAPQDAEPGGHYGVVFFGTEPPKLEEKDVNQVAIASMVGSLVLAKVPGQIIEKGNLETFSAPKFSFKSPIEFLVRIANIGNIHFKPKGEIRIKNWQGKTIDSVKVNTEEGNVLPDSTRRFTPKWEPKTSLFSPIGRYKAELKLSYGDSEKELSGELIFWIIPLWFITLLAVLIILAVVLIWRFMRKKRRSKKSENILDLRKR